MKLDHATIVSADVEAIRRFFVEVAGLAVGPRPPFGVDGFWLYAHQHPIIHLIETRSSHAQSSHRIVPGRIDHIALRVESAADWLRLLEKLRLTGTRYQLSSGSGNQETQLFVALEANVMIEFIVDSSVIGGAA